jgi:hypothetical protein
MWRRNHACATRISRLAVATDIHFDYRGLAAIVTGERFERFMQN